MSYSFEEPEWPPVCECRYDAARDEMDRGNCEIHCSMEDEVVPPDIQITRKKPPTIEPSKKENAA